MAVAGTNLDLVRRGFEAFNRGDIDAMLELLDPEVEWSQSPETAPEAAIYRGRDGVRELLTGVLDSLTAMEGFDEYRAEPLRILDVEDGRVLIEVRWSMRNVVTGTDVGRTEAQVWTLRDGKGLAVQEYGNWESARDAVALRDG